METGVTQDWEIHLKLPRSGTFGMKLVLLSYPGSRRVSVNMDFKLLYKMATKKGVCLKSQNIDTVMFTVP
jgi:hypothetical protein